MQPSPMRRAAAAALAAATSADQTPPAAVTDRVMSAVVSATEEALVRRWLARAEVGANSGIVHLASLLLTRVLCETDDADDPRDDEAGAAGAPKGELSMAATSPAVDGFGWLLRSMPAVHRSRLGNRILDLVALMDDGPSRAHGRGSAAAAADMAIGGGISGGGRWPLAVAMSVIELQIAAATAATESACSAADGGRAFAGDGLTALADRLVVVEAKMRWAQPGPSTPRTGARAAGRLGVRLDVQEDEQARCNYVPASAARLWLRLGWARAQSEELRGRAAASIDSLRACQSLLLRAPAFLGTVRPVPLLGPPCVIEASMLAAAEGRQAERRLLQEAHAALAAVEVHCGACVGGEWVSRLRVKDEAAAGEGEFRCFAAWEEALAAAATTARTLLVKAAAAEPSAVPGTGPAAESSFEQGAEPGSSTAAAVACGAHAVAAAAQLIASDDAALPVALALLHTCWVGVCTAPPAADAPTAEAIAPAAALAPLLGVYDDALHGALGVCARAAALADEPIEVGAQAASAMLGAVGAPSHGAFVCGVLVRPLERRLTGWLLRLMAALDAFQQHERRRRGWVGTAPLGVQSEARSTAPLGGYGASDTSPPMPLGVQSEASDASEAMVVDGGADASGEESWEEAVERLMPRVAAIAEYASTGLPTQAQSPTRPMLHHALTCFGKLWLLRARPSAEALLLLEGLWKAAAAFHVTSTPVVDDVRLDAVSGGVAASAARAARAMAGRRQVWEAPLAQLCLVTSLAELERLEAAGQTERDAPRLEERAATATATASCHGMLRSASLGSLSGSLDGLSGSAIASFGVPSYVHVIR